MMASLLLVYGIFNALCVGLLVILAHDAPLMDEDLPSDRHGDRLSLGAALAADETGLRPSPAEFAMPMGGDGRAVA